MPVPGSFADISETPSSNSPQGSETVGTIMNQYIQQAYAFIKMLYDGKMVPNVAVNMNSQQINNLANGVASTDAATVGQIAGSYLPLAGGILSGGLTVNAAILINANGQGQLTIRAPSNGTSGAGILMNDVITNTSKQIRVVNNVLQVVNNANTALIATVSDGGDFACTGNITASGNITAFSDDSIKTNWKSFSKNFVKRLARVKRGTFDRVDSNAKQLGVSAQSLRTVMPRAVVRDRKTGMLSVAYGQAGLVGAIEVADYAVQLEDRIKVLEREVRALKRKVK